MALCFRVSFKAGGQAQKKGTEVRFLALRIMFLFLRGIKLLIYISLDPFSYLYIWISYSLETIENDVNALQCIRLGLLTLTNDTVFQVPLKRIHVHVIKKRENIQEDFEDYDDIKELPRAINVATHSRLLLSIISFWRPPISFWYIHKAERKRRKAKRRCSSRLTWSIFRSLKFRSRLCKVLFFLQLLKFELQFIGMWAKSFLRERIAHKKKVDVVMVFANGTLKKNDRVRYN